MYYTDLASVPAAHYRILYADPPWVYRDRALAGNRGAGCKYRLTTDADLLAMPVARLMAPDACCFMWATMPKLPEALGLLTAWGFTYKTVAFTWIKRNKLTPSWFWGMGRWTRANAELVLLGTKGTPSRSCASVHSVIDTPIQGHSRKPAEARARIDRLLGPDGARLELFARGDQPDAWDRFGDTPDYPANLS